jgi:hypothetical protein
MIFPDKKNLEVRGHRAQSSGHRAQGIEHRAQGTGQRAKSSEQWAKAHGASTIILISNQQKAKNKLIVCCNSYDDKLQS